MECTIKSNTQDVVEQSLTVKQIFATNSVLIEVKYIMPQR